MNLYRHYIEWDKKRRKNETLGKLLITLGILLAALALLLTFG